MNPKMKRSREKQGISVEPDYSGIPEREPDPKLARVSTVKAYGGVWQLQYENGQQVYCGDEFEYQPNRRYNKVKRRVVDPKPIRVRLQYPPGRVPHYVEVEKVSSTNGFTAKLVRLTPSIRWVRVA